MKKLMTDLIVEEEFYAEDTHIYKSMMDVATEEELGNICVAHSLATYFQKIAIQNKITANAEERFTEIIIWLRCSTASTTRVCRFF